jgi:phosphatidylglycerol lysyltransferase
MNRLRTWAPALVGLLLLVIAAWVLQAELSKVSYRQVAATIAALPRSAVLASLGFMALNYLLLTGFDLLGFFYIGRRDVPAWKVGVASFTGYAISNSVGFAVVSGTSVRFRFYSRWGLTAGDISRIAVIYFSTFWLGLLVMGGWSLAFDPHPRLVDRVGLTLMRVVGLGMLGAALGYFLLAIFRRRPLRVWRWELPVPPPGLVLWQVVLSAADWALATAIFYAVLPQGTGLTFFEFLNAFLTAQIAGHISHVPGGLGVFEGTMVMMLSGYMKPEVLLSSLVVYRIVYYIIPLVIGMLVLVSDEARQRWHLFARWKDTFGGLTLQLAPKALAAFTFAAGVLLLFSGAAPGGDERVAEVLRWVPLPLLETSHFLGSVIGVWLLVLSNGVARRLGLAYYSSGLALVLGIVSALLRGSSLEIAGFLAFVIAALAVSRPAFDRRAAFWDGRFDPGFVTALVAVVGSSLWLFFFAFKHVQYSDELWWRFAADAAAPRALRASVGATVALLAVGVLRLQRPAPPEELPPTLPELDEVGQIVARQPETVPYLVYLRDKALLFSSRRDAFLMYAVQGRTWVALGDPVGQAPDSTELIRQFFGRCDDFGGVPVFYRVGPERLPQYGDLGLTSARLGEEAVVPLEGFEADDALASAGLRFRVAAPAEVVGLLPELREVSAEWMAKRRAEERGFSFGFFDADYLSRFPAALAERDGRVVGFATVWPGADRGELSADLVRFRDDAPEQAQVGLLVALMGWGRAEGFRRFNLGMAPGPGMELTGQAPMWARAGSWVYRRGEALYSYDAVRACEPRFRPEWRPRYVAYPGGLPLPRILGDVSALIAGGYRDIFARHPRR